MKRVRVYEITKRGPEEEWYDHYKEVFTSRPILTFRAARSVLQEQLEKVGEEYEMIVYARNRIRVQMAEKQLLIIIHHNLTESLNTLETPHYE